MKISCDFECHKNRKPPSNAPGIDFAVPVGTKIYSQADGRVTGSSFSEIGGRRIWIRNGEIARLYCHLEAVYVLAGEQVEKGQLIALSGNTGKSTGPHLHYSKTINGQYVDPAPEEPFGE